VSAPEFYMGHEIAVRYDPDGTWPARWTARVYYKVAVYEDYCATVYGATERRAARKARRYVRRRVRRVARHQ
jgi:hypothetical protein